MRVHQTNTTYIAERYKIASDTDSFIFINMAVIRKDFGLSFDDILRIGLDDGKTVVSRGDIVETIEKEATWGQAAINALGAAGRVLTAIVNNDPVYVAEPISNARAAICISNAGGCYDESAGRCTQCKCVTEFKTKLQTEKCPLGKW